MGIALIIVGIAGIALLGSGFVDAGRPPNTAEGCGEWIFRGNRPDHRAADSPDRGMVMATSCAACHGAKGQGLRTPLFTNPNISYENPTDSSGILEPDGSRSPTYADEQIKRAITQGVDADGQPLAWSMQR